MTYIIQMLIPEFLSNASGWGSRPCFGYKYCWPAVTLGRLYDLRCLACACLESDKKTF